MAPNLMTENKKPIRLKNSLLFEEHEEYNVHSIKIVPNITEKEIYHNSRNNMNLYSSVERGMSTSGVDHYV